MDIGSRDGRRSYRGMDRQFTDSFCLDFQPGGSVQAARAFLPDPDEIPAFSKTAAAAGHSTPGLVSGIARSQLPCPLRVYRRLGLLPERVHAFLHNVFGERTKPEIGRASC